MSNVTKFQSIFSYSPKGTHSLLIRWFHEAWIYESWFIFTKLNVGFVKLSYVWTRHDLVYCPLLTSYTFHCLSILLNENTTWILVTFKGFSVFCIATSSYHPPRWYLSSTSQPWFIIFWSWVMVLFSLWFVELSEWFIQAYFSFDERQSC